MKKFTVILSLILGLAFSPAFAGKTYYCGGPSVTLTGMLANRNATDIQFGKEVPVTYPALVLPEPINLTGEGECDGIRKDVGTIQLGISEHEDFDLYDKNVGKLAKVTCDLYGSHTAHHFTPIVCSVEKLEIIKKH